MHEFQSPRLSPASHDETQWYRDAVIYQVHVRAFYDSNRDGVGDFPGLTAKLDYIQSLGVSAIWLLPFYPSPLKDDGYDIADYKGIHPGYGTRRDFLAFMQAAKARGLKVITELVINHTSDEHPWFRAARAAKAGSAKRAFYVWSDTDERYAGVPIIFKDTERSNWAWDPVAGQYYWHRFFRHQPDLNFDHPPVLKAVLRVMRFWLDMGVDGMRLDAVPYLVEREGTTCASLPETHDILRAIRRDLDARYQGRMLLAEANQWPSDVRAFFGDGDECHMAFHFPLMPRLFMALRQEDRHPISEILYQTPDLPDGCQWATFLRNHDELTLEMVSEDERDYMYRAYAADPEMRINVGIRRRLAPLLENSRPRIELLTALLLSLPGTPVLYYGDEIGMGDNVYLGDRNGVRTPMQWSADRNGGFSGADPARLYAPPVMDPVFGYTAVNVEAQERSSHSLLAWMRRMIALRQRHPTFGRGSMELLRPANRRILAFIRRYGSEDPILVVANLSRTVQAVSLHLGALAGRVPVEMSGGVDLPRITDAPYPLTLGPHACYWLALPLEAPVDVSRQRPAAEPESDAGPLLVGPDWNALFDGSVRHLIERRYLPSFLARQPWFTLADGPISRVQIVDWGAIRRGDEPVFVTIVQVTCAQGEPVRYLVPLAAAAGARAHEIVQQTPAAVLALVSGARQGVLHARFDEGIGDALLQMVLSGRDARLKTGTLRSRRFGGFDALMLPARVEDLPRRPRDLERCHSSGSYGEQVMLKLLRRPAPEAPPAIRIAERLRGAALAVHVPELLALVDYDAGADGQQAIAVLESFIPNQRTAWQHAIDDLQRFVDGALTRDVPETIARAWPLQSSSEELRGSAATSVFVHEADGIGRRLAALHAALADGDAAADDAKVWAGAAVAERLAASAERARMALATSPTVTESAGPLAAEFLTRHEQIAETVHAALRHTSSVPRVAPGHGDLDLTDVLLFEGDPWFLSGGSAARTAASAEGPLPDVARLLRSIRHVGETVLASRTSATPQEQGRVSAWVRAWTADASAVLVSGYRAAARAGSPLEAADAPVWLWLCLVEQACNELGSSVAARPAWVPVLLREILDTLDEGLAAWSNRAAGQP